MSRQDRQNQAPRLVRAVRLGFDATGAPCVTRAVRIMGADGPRRVTPEDWQSDDPDVVDQVRAVCGICPVRPECLAEALAHEEGKGSHARWGIWAGLTGAERHALDLGGARCRT